MGATQRAWLGLRQMAKNATKLKISDAIMNPIDQPGLEAVTA